MTASISYWPAGVLVCLCVTPAFGSDRPIRSLDSLEAEHANVSAALFAVPPSVGSAAYADKLAIQEASKSTTRFPEGTLDGPSPTLSVTVFTDDHRRITFYYRGIDLADQPALVCRVDFGMQAFGEAQKQAYRWCIAALGTSPIVVRQPVIPALH